MNKTNSTEPTQTGWYLMFIAWLIVTTATLGSLFFSEVMDVPICKLCWYQRIAMYPMVLILAVGLFPYDSKVVRIVGLMAAIGWIIALFQVLLIAGIIPESAQPCVQGIPCSESHVALLGFLNIPALSLITFSLVIILLKLTTRMESS